MKKKKRYEVPSDSTTDFTNIEKISKYYVQLCATEFKQFTWHDQIAWKTQSTKAHLGRDNLGGLYLLNNMNS